MLGKKKQQPEPTDEAIRIIGDLARLEFRPGDRFVLQMPGVVSMGQHEHIQEVWRQFVGGDAEAFKLLVIDNGAKLSVLSEPEC